MDANQALGAQDYLSGIVPPELAKANTAAKQQYQSDLGAEQKELSPVIKKAQDISNTPLPTPPKAAKVTPAPDAAQFNKDAQGWVNSLAVLSSLIGARGRARGTGALKAFSAGLNGIQKGNQQAFDNATKTWKENTDAMFKESEEQYKEYEAVINNRELSEKEMTEQVKLIGVKWQNTLTMDVENVGQIGALIDSFAKAKFNAEMTANKMQEKIDFKQKQDQENADKRSAFLADVDNLPGSATVPGTGLTVDALKQRSDQYNMDPSVLARGGLPVGDKDMIVDYNAQVNAKNGITGPEVVARQAEQAADRSSLVNLQKQADASTAFAKTAKDNFAQAMSLAPKAIPDMGPLFNRWVMEGDTMLGDKNVPAYQLSLLTGASEWAKVMSGATGAAGSTVEARQTAYEHFKPYLNTGQIAAVAKVATDEMDNRTKEYHNQLQEIKARMTKRFNPNVSEPETAPAAPTNAPDYSHLWSESE